MLYFSGMTAADTGGRIADYFVNIEALQARAEAPNATPQTISSPTPFASSPFISELSPYGQYLLAALLFLCAFWIQIKDGIRSTKHLVIIFLLSGFAASVPFALAAINASFGLQARAAPQEMPRMVHIFPSAAHEVKVTWQTEDAMVGAVRYGVTPFDLSKTTPVIADGGERTMVHTAILSGLSPGVNYVLEILSGTRWYDENGRPILFTYR